MEPAKFMKRKIKLYLSMGEVAKYCGHFNILESSHWFYIIYIPPTHRRNSVISKDPQSLISLHHWFEVQDLVL